VVLAVLFGMQSPHLTADNNKIHRTFFLLQQEFSGRFSPLDLFVFAEPGKYPEPYSPVLSETLRWLGLFRFIEYDGEFRFRRVGGSDLTRGKVLSKFNRPDEKSALQEMVERFDQECGVSEE